MPDGGHGVNEEHARSGVAHHRTYLLTLVGSIAVYEALAAARLGVSLRAQRQSLPGILQQFQALGAHLAAAMMRPAVHGYHPPYNGFLSFNAFHTCKDSDCLRHRQGFIAAG